MKRTFYVRAVWDPEVQKYYTDSDILGLAIETSTIEEFEDVMQELAVELIISNHTTADDLASKPMRDLVPAIIWHRPDVIAAAA